MCEQPYNDCTNSQECLDFWTCLDNCTDQTCAQNCSNQYTAGYLLYFYLIECAFCNACPSDCANEGQGLCY